MGHNCILCGAELPNRKGGRCYCKPCGEYMRAKRLREGNEERKVLRIKHEIEPKPPEKREVTLKKADMAYCRKCDYHGNFDQQILCEYMVRTGHRRGCRSGAGCEKREVTKNEETANA